MCNPQPKLNPAVLACYLTAAASGTTMCSAEASWRLSMPVKRKLKNSDMSHSTGKIHFRFNDLGQIGKVDSTAF